MEFTSADLGAVIKQRRLRREPPMTQKALGEAAGYGEGPGAGVAMSRIENGSSSPREDKLERIAAALDVSVPILLGEARAHRRLVEDGTIGGDDGPTKQRSLKAQARALHRLVEKRAAQVTESADRFNAAHDRARDDFFVPFFDVASHLVGAPTLPPSDDDAPPEAAGPAEDVAEAKIQTSSRLLSSALAGAAGAAAGAPVGGAVAYGAFTAAASLGTASTGTAIASLSGAASTNATLAFIGGGSLATGGAGVAGGTTVLAGMVAGPVALLAIGGVLMMARRNKQKEIKLQAQLEKAEHDLDATAPGFEALLFALQETTALLEYIAIHGAHAYQRWVDALESRRAWDDLSIAEREAYEKFREVAGAQVSVARVNFGAYLTLRGPELERFLEETETVLQMATKQVKSLV
ncbi:MAG: XRE family transcriptional regulator [Comamonadaceae bacterium]|nr:MAG: XRE family transcriptional regulator [Comamonadaceae bacterium]